MGFASGTLATKHITNTFYSTKVIKKLENVWVWKPFGELCVFVPVLQIWFHSNMKSRAAVYSIGVSHLASV